MNNKDAEVVYNLIQLYMLEHFYTKAVEMIKYFHERHDQLKVVDKPITWYDKKIALFEKFLNAENLLKIHK